MTDSTHDKNAEAQSGGVQPEQAGSETVSLDDALKESLGDAVKVEELGQEAPAEEKAAEPEEQAEEKPEGGSSESETPEEPAVEIPDAFSAEHKEALSGLSAEARKTFLDLYKGFEADYTRKTQDLSAKTKLADEIERIMGPQAAALTANGMTVAQGIAQLVQLQNMYQNDPKGYLEMIAKSVRQRMPDLDLSTLTEPPDIDVDPQVRQLQQTVQALSNELNQFKQNATQADIQGAENDLKAFAEAKDSEGNPLHPHFDQIKVKMGLLMKASADAGQGMTLEDAYSQAVRTDATLHDAMIAKRVEEALKAERQKQEVERARPGKEIDAGQAPAQKSFKGQKLDDILSQTTAELTGA